MKQAIIVLWILFAACTQTQLRPSHPPAKPTKPSKPQPSGTTNANPIPSASTQPAAGSFTSWPQPTWQRGRTLIIEDRTVLQIKPQQNWISFSTINNLLADPKPFSAAATTAPLQTDTLPAENTGWFFDGNLNLALVFQKKGLQLWQLDTTQNSIHKQPLTDYLPLLQTSADLQLQIDENSNKNPDHYKSLRQVKNFSPGTLGNASRMVLRPDSVVLYDANRKPFFRHDTFLATELEALTESSGNNYICGAIEVAVSNEKQSSRKQFLIIKEYLNNCDAAHGGSNKTFDHIYLFEGTNKAQLIHFRDQLKQQNPYGQKEATLVHSISESRFPTEFGRLIFRRVYNLIEHDAAGKTQPNQDCPDTSEQKQPLIQWLFEPKKQRPILLHEF